MKRLRTTMARFSDVLRRNILERSRRYRTAVRESASMKAMLAEISRFSDLCEFPAIPGVRFDACFVPQHRNLLGGDWYDIFELEPGRVIGFSIGDVGGHGVSAALNMHRVKQTIRVASKLRQLSPEDVLRKANEVIQLWPDSPMITAVYGTINVIERTLTYVCAGHFPPLILTAEGQLIEDGNDGFPLGIEPDIELTTYTLPIPLDARIVMHTDGMIEIGAIPNVITGQQDFLDTAREIVRTNSETMAKDICDMLLPEENVDDATVLIIAFDEHEKKRSTKIAKMPAITWDSHSEHFVKSK